MKMPPCPKCEQADQVEKVSTIYMVGIGAGRLPKLAGNPPASPGLTDLRLPGITAKELYALSRRLAPPSGGKPETIRPVHPDWVVSAFTLILPFFLFQIARQQPGVLIWLGAGILLLYGLYFWQRKTVIAKYENQIEARKQQAGRVEQAVGRWMKAYYCAQDDVVFVAGKPKWAPADEMQDLLFS